MMKAVKGALEDADVALLIVDLRDNWEECDTIFSSLHLKVPAIVVVNKIDLGHDGKNKRSGNFFEAKSYCKKIITISALSGINKKQFMKAILEWLPEGEPFYTDDNISDLPTKFFVSELIREKIYTLYEDEIPYHTAVLVQEYKEKSTLIKIRAEIIVQRETQKGIILGRRG